MHKHIKRTVVMSAGIIFIALGLVGLVVPFLQGILFLALGLILLSLYSPTIRDWMELHTKRYPKFHAVVQRLEEWMVKIIGRPQ